jgi:hypothetical protein
MSLDEKFIPVRTVFYETVGNFSRRQLDYWDTNNPEMPLFPIFQVKFILDRNFLITRHRTFGLQFSDLKRGLK